MTITRAQADTLHPGDIVEITCDNWPTGTKLTGPLRVQNGNLVCGDMLVRWADGAQSLDSRRHLTVTEPAVTR